MPLNKVNPGYPGFPQEIDPAGNSTVIDHGAEIAAAQAAFAAAHKVAPESSKNHHTSKERRNRPESMEHGKQILGSKK